MNERQQFIDSVDAMLTNFVKLTDLVNKGIFDEALNLVKETDFDKATRNRLLAALDTRDSQIIKPVIEDYKLRIAQAMCDSCKVEED